MAHSLWDISDQKKLQERLKLLDNSSPRKWGTMDVGQMIRHMDIAYKNAMGELPVPQHSLAFIVSLAPVRKLIIYVVPFQKSLPTAQEYKVRSSIDFQAAYNEFSNTFQKITSFKDTSSFGAHPIFGRLSQDEWGALLYKHLDHHLRQFGV